jgi:hypothetical protein
MFKLLERAAPGPQPLHRNRPQRLRLGTRWSVYLARLLSYSRPVETTIVNPLLKTLNEVTSVKIHIPHPPPRALARIRLRLHSSW